MIKQIIFDIDNTLIDVPKNIDIEFQKLLNKFNVNVLPMDLYRAVGTYEIKGEHEYFTKEKLVEVVNNVLNLQLTIEFADEFLNTYNELITIVEDGVIETLKYLKSKYRIVALSNWFTESQKIRLEKVGLLEYFDEVYGTDIVPMKPRKESFISVMGDFKPEECVMIGDNLKVDIEVPFEMGINVFHINKFGITKYPTIKRIIELKERL